MLSSVVESHAATCEDHPKKQCIKPNFEKSGDAFSLLMKVAYWNSKKQYFVCDKEMRCFISDEKPAAEWDQDVAYGKKRISVCSATSSGTQTIKESVLNAAKGFLESDIIDHLQQYNAVSPGILKSIMQKAVRRRAGGAAIWAAVSLVLAGEHMQLFRRFPIIVVEDSILHDEYDFLVWCMMSVGKGFVPNQVLFEKYLLIVMQVSLCPIRDLIDGESCSFDEMNFDNPKYRSLCCAIRIRAGFGGMTGDIDLLKSTGASWNKRFARHAEWITVLTKLHRGINRRLFKVSIPLASIDCHCCPWILEKMDIENAETVMWKCDGALNSRRILSLKEIQQCRLGCADVTNKVNVDPPLKYIWDNEMKQPLEAIRLRFLKGKICAPVTFFE